MKAFLMPLLLFSIAPSNDWIGKPAPELADGVWINSKPLTLSALRGKVVVLEFWTFACWNCRNTIPYVKAWHEKFKGDDFQLIGVHTPEFAREKVLENVKAEIKSLGIEYAVMTDNEFKTWRLYKQEYWPCVYVIDKKGIIRYVHIGEGKYDETVSVIAKLLAEN